MCAGQFPQRVIAEFRMPHVLLVNQTHQQKVIIRFWDGFIVEN